MTISLRSDSGGTSGAVQVNGTDVLALTSTGAMTVPTVTGSFKNLKASATGLNATTLVSADEVVVSDGVSSYKILRNVSLSIGAGSGANGLDSGSLSTSTWYSLWVIWNGSTVAGLLSTSETAPSLPVGYTHKARVGWIRTDGTVNKYPLAFKQYGRRVRYAPSAVANITILPAVSFGVVSASQVSVSAFIPATASSVAFCAISTTATNSAIFAGATSSSIVLAACNANAGQTTVMGDIQIENPGAQTVYLSAQASTASSVYGWEDNL